MNRDQPHRYLVNKGTGCIHNIKIVILSCSMLCDLTPLSFTFWWNKGRWNVGHRWRSLFFNCQLTIESRLVIIIILSDTFFGLFPLKLSVHIVWYEVMTQTKNFWPWSISQGHRVQNVKNFKIFISDYFPNCARYRAINQDPVTTTHSLHQGSKILKFKKGQRRHFDDSALF